MGKLDFRVTKKTSDAAFAHNSLLYYTTTQFNRSWGKLGSELLVNLTISLQNGVKWSPGKKKMHFDFGVLEMHLKNA
jgi:hypothetical protein